jgi:hypothetical protein
MMSILYKIDDSYVSLIMSQNLLYLFIYLKICPKASAKYNRAYSSYNLITDLIQVCIVINIYNWFNPVLSVISPTNPQLTPS